MRKAKFAITSILFLSTLLSSSPAAATTMTDLASIVAKRLESGEEQAIKSIREIFAAITEELKSGEEVTIRNFGKFYIKERGPRKAKNPRTGETIAVAAKRYPRFKSSEKLKDQLNE